MDRILELIQPFALGYNLKYNRHYIGLALHGYTNNFVSFRLQKTAVRLDVGLPKTDETGARLETAGLEVLEYDSRSGAYKIRLSADDVEKHQELLGQLMREGFEATQ